MKTLLIVLHAVGIGSALLLHNWLAAIWAASSLMWLLNADTFDN